MRKSHERCPDFSIEWHEVPHILFPIRSLIENAGNPSHEPASISTIHPHHVHTRASRISLYLHLSRPSHLSYQKTPLLSSANNPLPAFTLALQSTVPNTLPPSYLSIYLAPQPLTHSFIAPPRHQNSSYSYLPTHLPNPIATSNTSR